MPVFKAKDLIGSEREAVYDKLIATCPVCHHAIEPTSFRIGAVNERFWFEMITRCPRTECQRTLVAHYRFKAVDGNGRYNYEWETVYPRTAQEAEIDPDVVALSPSFVKIYNQALSAEVAGLDEVFGISLRKALEFLIKDYCIRNHPTEADAIKDKFLGRVIKDYVTDLNVKKCAERAVWLGNDETHYMRVWESHDINDLKALIKLTVNWIANELLTAKYFSGMQP